MMNKQRLTGIIPATILPLEATGEIDDSELRRLIRFLEGVDGVTSLVCNGHAGHANLLSREERRRVIEIHVDEVKSKVPIIAGIHAEATWQVIELMEDARESGASAVLILPPNTLRGFTDLGPEIPCQFFSTVAQAVDIPIVVYQNPKSRGYSYTSETLVKLTEIQNIVAMKMSTGDIQKYERDISALKNAKRRVSILASNDAFLFASFSHGADGALVGLGNLVPHWLVELFQAIEHGEIEKAREINSRIFPLVECIYKGAGSNTYGVMKEALFMLGILTKPSFSRSPLPPVCSAIERAALKNALMQSGLLSFYQSSQYIPDAK
ncbi:dihydrodipicolinate synthase family protein [Chloroflexota bacterium]